LLGRMDTRLRKQREQSVEEAAATQATVVQILLVNTACGALLCLLGLFFVRRWVVQPVEGLREATRHLSAGEFGHRIEPKSRDELGLLAGEVNQMASIIAQMQERLVEQERLAGAAEMVKRLAHNIRNPLAGIRGLAEATSDRHQNDNETRECQQRIVETVDRFEKWLRDLQESVSPMTLCPQPTRIDELIRQVITALKPMFHRRDVEIQMNVSADLSPVHLDSMHFEQALVALLTNAVQASQPGQSVRIEVRPCPDRSGDWQLIVEDQGEGIPDEIRDKIFVPYFTTKPGGTGVGLAIAGKVIKAHGGQLTVDSRPGQGSRFVAILPGLAKGGPNGRHPARG